MLTYTGLEIMFPKFPIMVISSHESHDFPAFSIGFFRLETLLFRRYKQFLADR
jgi:hypothetical protein